jgi:hypothetical protein
MSKITPIWQIVFGVRFCKRGLNNYEGGLNNMVVPVISARQRYFYGSIRTGHGSLRRTESTTGDDDAARSAAGYCQPNWGVPLLSISARGASYGATGFVT